MSATRTQLAEFLQEWDLDAVPSLQDFKAWKDIKYPPKMCKCRGLENRDTCMIEAAPNSDYCPGCRSKRCFDPDVQRKWRETVAKLDAEMRATLPQYKR